MDTPTTQLQPTQQSYLQNIQNDQIFKTLESSIINYQTNQAQNTQQITILLDLLNKMFKEDKIKTALYLLTICMNSNNNVEVRVHAISVLRNEIVRNRGFFEKRLASGASNCNPNESIDNLTEHITLVANFKAAILNFYLNLNDETNTADKVLIKQVSNIIALTCKLTKLETWKELTNLIKSNSPDIFCSKKMLILINEIITQLSSQRLAIAKQKFTLLISEILPFNHFSNILERICQEEAGGMFIKLFISFFKATTLVTKPMQQICIDLSRGICDLIVHLLNLAPDRGQNLDLKNNYNNLLKKLVKLLYRVVLD